MGNVCGAKCEVKSTTFLPACVMSHVYMMRITEYHVLDIFENVLLLTCQYIQHSTCGTINAS